MVQFLVVIKWLQQFIDKTEVNFQISVISS